MALILDGMIIQSPTSPMRTWALGTNGMKPRMPHPTASIQAPPTPTMRSPKRLRNHVNGIVKRKNVIEPYSEGVGKRK